MAEKMGFVLTKSKNVVALVWYACILNVILFINGTLAQEENKLIRQGNTLYKEKKYNEALASYEKASKIKPENKEAQFNKADALYRLGRHEEAANLFQGIASQFDTEEKKAAAYHNLGNSFLKQKRYQDAVDAYKKALRSNSNDEDTRYNLAYALKMIQKQQNQNNKDNKQNKDNKSDKDKNQQKQDQKNKNDQEKEKDKKDDSDKQDKNDDKQDKDDQQRSKPNRNEMKKEDAQRILDALNREEKDLQDRLRREMRKAVRVEIEKDW